MATLYVVEAALAEDEEQRKQRALLDEMRRNIWTPPPGAPDVVTLLRRIREDEGAITDTDAGAH